MTVQVLDKSAVQAILPDRVPWGHKGDFGQILLLCGSVGYTGAAALAARAALRAGAGLIYLGVPQPIYPILAVKLDEPVVFPLPSRDGTLAEAAVPEILDRLAGCDACLAGPGLGRSAGVLAVMSAVLGHARCPVVVDADGINVLAAHKDILRERTGSTILTPHDGEFSRLAPEASGSRLAQTMTLAKALGAIILRKGHRTLITDGTAVYENRTGNPGMATGGSGDVLSGLLAALLGQGIDPLPAAACAAWIHGAAGDLCAAQLGQYGMTPTDMVEALPRLLK